MSAARQVRLSLVSSRRSARSAEVKEERLLVRRKTASH